MPYTPKSAPGANDIGQLKLYLQQELTRIGTAIALLEQGRFTVLYSAPDRPREGQLVCADGTSWDPGSGAGYYRFDGANWQFIG